MDLQTQRLMMAAAGAVGGATYVDDVFSTYLYEETGSALTINNGVDMTEGGMVWFKNREASDPHALIDTERGGTKVLHSNTDEEQSTESGAITSFNNNGFSIGTYGTINGGSNKDVVSWTFRKAPGFFDVVTYTGNNTNGRTVSHSLGCVPGMILIKRSDYTGANWVVYHRSTDATEPALYRLRLNTTMARSGGYFNNTEPTASVFTLGTDSEVNGNGAAYVAYLFAGGDKGYNSVDFDGSGDYLLTSSGSDYTFGTGDFTVEHWFKTDNWATSQMIDGRMNGSSYQTNWCTYIESGKTYRFFVNGDQITSSALADNTWYHAAVVRNSGTTTLYINGVSQGTYSDSNDYDNTQITVGIHGPNRSSFPYEGKISNLRVVKGTAVYTSAFTAPTAPLSNVTNTKLICCNGTTTTSTTVGNISEGGDPFVTETSPFTSTDAVFGENGDQSIIRCGRYVGNGSSTRPKIDLGWEPSFLFLKNSSHSNNWYIWDSMRGIVTNENSEYIFPNTDGAAGAANGVDLYPDGFNTRFTGGGMNASGNTYVYMAIRRPDGYCGKPADAGTDVFAMDTASGSSTIPTWDSGFPVDFRFHRTPGISVDWYTGTRLTGGGRYVKTNSSDAEANIAGTDDDSNEGFGTGHDGSWQAWMWKRHAGLDVVTVTPGATGEHIQHNLGKVPEMIWAKDRGQSAQWSVYHKGLNGGTNPEEYRLKINADDADQDTANAWNDEAPTATHFTVGSWPVNNAMIFILFASVDGISKVGYYSGQSGNLDLDLGFAARFIVIKRTNAAGEWWVFDSLRGIVSGNDYRLYLNSTSAQNSSDDWVDAHSDGITINNNKHQDILTTSSSDKYIYYAHG